MKQIILASGSPRRKALMQQIGLTFKVVPSEFKEDMTLPMKPSALARYLSMGKARTVAKHYPKSLVIAADTFIAFKGKLLGKPKNLVHARTMLNLLSGSQHAVITGFALIDGNTKKKISRAVITKVFFRTLSSREISAYVNMRKPLDLAGAYAIQEISGIFVKKIVGDYFNIVGLPLCALAEELKKFGISVL